jgi:Zn-dependent protease with chaperone function
MAKIDAYYPASPKNVPPELTEPTAEYKSRVFLLLLSLLFAYGLYLILTLGSLAVAILAPIFVPCFGFVVSIPALFFFLFLVKGFFKTRQREKSVRVEVTAEDQPLLFAFIERICDETGAPPPRRVFIIPDVNAAVVSRNGIASLIWPTGRDLVIGLGLISFLNLTEFKWVLAHEFGHFAQKKTMRLGSYAYVALGVFHDIVFSRDWFDGMIEGMMRVRNYNGTPNLITALGWTIFGLTWMLRKVLEGAFFLIYLLESALSRQMEFNADLVAVSITGSDGGIHAFYKLTCCDVFYEQMWRDLMMAYQHKLISADVFYHLNHAANYVRKQKKDPRFGLPPQLSDNPRDDPDLFEPEDTGTPKMWASHPSNYAREQNAKAYYIRCPIDERSAWVLFKNPQALREEVTYRRWRADKVIKKNQQLADPEEVQAFIDDEHAETTYDPRYHGLYDARYIEIDDLDDLVEEAKKAAWDEGRLERVHLKLYDNELKEWMEGRNNRVEEYNLLSGLVSGELELKEEELEFRGRHYDIREAKRLLKKVDKEMEEDRQFFSGIDRRAFLVYYQMGMQADEKLRKELFKRYDFHLTCQDMLRKLSAEKAHMEAVLAMVANRQGRGLDHHEFRAALKACRDAQKALKKVLSEADELPMPDMANMKKGKPVGHFLLDKKLVHSLDRDEDSVSPQWINALMSQLSEVKAKLMRIHFKSLGGILILQDRIFQKWKEHLASMPTVQAVTEEPAAGKPAPASPSVAAKPVPAKEEMVRRDREGTATSQAAQAAAKLAQATAPSKPATPPKKT